MLILRNLVGRDKTNRLAVAFGFIHTVEVFWRRPDPFSAQLKNSLRYETRRKVWDEPLLIDGVHIGWILKINSPTKHAIEILEQYWEEEVMSICRLHVAYDLDPIGISAEDIRTLMTGHTHLKYRKTSDRIRRKKGTVYSIDTARRKGRLSKNWMYYDDEPGDLDGELNKPHFEIRLLSGAAIKREEIFRPTDLFGIKPRSFWKKHISIRDHAEKIIEETIRRTRPSPFIDIPRRVCGLLARTDNGTLTDFRRNFPRQFEKLGELEVLDICEELQWAPAKGREKEKVWGKFCILSHQKAKPRRQQKGRIIRERL